ncbi:MAG: hypothetical protein CMA21_04575 [Euryarchaeota archaeon]|nr:hypothetical protein [Euryarchaeota archaeon]
MNLDKASIDGSTEPIFHSPRDVHSSIQNGDLESAVVRETIAALALAGFRGESDKWGPLWNIADQMKKEVSVLIDRDGNTWVDIGSSGEVRLAPAFGSIAPYQLWLHTHPYSAYASSTDRETLASCSMILEQAIVLGHDHMVWLKRDYSGNRRMLEPEGPLSTWTTDEEIITYASMLVGNDV